MSTFDSHVQCDKCGEQGHVQVNCPDRFKDVDSIRAIVVNLITRLELTLGNIDDLTPDNVLPCEKVILTDIRTLKAQIRDLDKAVKSFYRISRI